MSHHYTPEGYAAQFAKEDTVAQDPNGQPIQPEQPPFHGQHPSGQWGQPSPDMNQYPPHYQPPGYFGQPIPPGPGYAHPGQQMHSGYYPPHHAQHQYQPPNGSQQMHPQYYSAPNQQHNPHHNGHHPMWGHPHMMHPAYNHQPHMPNQSPSQPEMNADKSDPFMEQAQAMLEQALGEDAGMFKDILGSLGMNDKEFWKGAMIGAAAALLLSNDNVRGKLLDVVSGAGDMLKSGGGKVKEAANQTAGNVKDSVNNSGEIFKDTYSAGRQGFQESVERHYHAAEEAPADNETVPVETVDLASTQDEMKPA